MSSSRWSIENSRLASSGEWAGTMLTAGRDSARSLCRFYNPSSVRRAFSPSRRAVMAGILTVSVACSSVQPADHYQFMAPSDDQSAIYMVDDDGDGAATLLQQLVDDASASGHNASDVSANSGNDGNGSGITLSRSADGNLFSQATDSPLQGVVAARPAGAPSGAAEPVKQQFFTSGSGGSAAEAEARIVSAMSALANVAAVSSGGLPAPKTLQVAPTATPARPVMAAPAAPPATPVVVVPTASPNSSAPTAVTETTEDGFSRGRGKNNGGSANQDKSGGNRGSEPATEPTPEPETPTLDSKVQRLIAAYEAGDISIEKLLKELAKIYS